MLWKKPGNMKYTDMCVFIDEHIPELADAGKYPAIENTVYNYLWLLTKALAIKKRMFQSFSDYDGYAFYAANRLYFSLKKNYLNQGKTIKGKLIRPVKSCLNYTKKLLYPMKIEYQTESYNKIISEEWVTKKFDAFAYREQMKNEIKYSADVLRRLEYYIKASFSDCGGIIDRVVDKTFFAKNSLDYKYLKTTLIINCLYNFKMKKKLDTSNYNVMLWKLPKSMASYIKVLLNEIYTEIKLEVLECSSLVRVDDKLAEKMLSGREEYGGNYEE